MLHTDGYSAYAWYAKKTGIAHAQWWAHSRRAFLKAEAIEPARVAEALELCLDDPGVEIDTNSLERALRAIPMGKKNWMFCWTELGAKQIGIAQSLLVTCKLHDIDPYDYLVDVLQRVGQHPASRVHELTPRMWKSLFADNPLRSPLHQIA